MNEGIRIIIEPMNSKVKGLYPRLRYPLRDVPPDRVRGKSLKQIYTEKNQRTQTHG